MKNKFNAKKTRGFASKKEAYIHDKLKIRALAGEIKDLECQPSFVIIEPFECQGKKIRGAKYTADFKYWDCKDKYFHIIEVKSKYTAKLADYVLRKKLFLKKYVANSKICKFFEII